ncbi:rubrerythrin [Peptoniphilus catoniae]|uniref:rubrerythrin n=1 Tax=Peptoniphilus catoniae TaxID=1660341 RepID=UPI0010FD2D81|nr:rubrerythrin family protein [Peptoniphilus catoniae]
MKELKGTKTAENLMKSFAGECQAATRYTYYANQAKKDKYIQISKIFEETSRNEVAHAKRFFKFLNKDLDGEAIEITAGFPVHLGDTLSNLKAAAAGENEEHSSMYPEFEKVAREEGFEEIAKVFHEVAEVEEAHEKRYLKLAKNIEEGKVWKKDEVVLWKCNNCGYIHEGKEAPEICPACAHGREHFELFKETY